MRKHDRFKKKVATAFTADELRRGFCDLIAKINPMYLITLTPNAALSKRFGERPESFFDEMKRLLGKFESRVNRRLVGGGWKKRKSERIFGLAFYEKADANPHWHLVVNIPKRTRQRIENRNLDLKKICEDQWTKLVPGGSTDIRPITTVKNLAIYVTKEISSPNYENYVPLPTGD